MLQSLYECHLGAANETTGETAYLLIFSLLLRNVLHDLCNKLPLHTYIYIYIYLHTHTHFNLIHVLFLTSLTHVDWRLLKFRHVS